MPDDEIIEDEELQEHIGEGLENYMELMQQANEPVEAESWEAALEPDDGLYVWNIPTGDYDEAGRPVAVTVKAEDPKNQALMVAYMLSEDKEEAARSLWKACIVEPEEIVEEDTYANLRTKFKMGVTARILDMLGQDAGNPLTSMTRRSTDRSKRQSKESLTESQNDSTSTQDESKTSSAQKKSSTDTSTTSTDSTKSDDTASKTGDSSSEASSKRTSSTQSNDDSIGNVQVETG